MRAERDSSIFDGHILTSDFEKSMQRNINHHLRPSKVDLKKFLLYEEIFLPKFKGGIYSVIGGL